MGLSLCAGSLGRLDKYKVDPQDTNDENPEIRPSKGVYNGNADMDTKDKSDSVRKAAEAGERSRAMSAPRKLRLFHENSAPAPKPVERSELLERPTLLVRPKLLEASLDVKSTKKSRRNKSLQAKMVERQNDPNPCGEFAGDAVKGEREGREAKSYMDALQDNTVEQIKETFQHIESMVLSETDTIEELKRQGKVVKEANLWLCDAKKDMNDTNNRLTGMTSLTNKVAKLIRKPALSKYAPIYDSDDEELGGIKRSNTTPIKLPSQRFINKSEWIDIGVDQINHLLDIVQHKEIELGHEIEKQDKVMQRLDKNMDQIEYGIAHQAKLMSSIAKK